LQGVVCWHLRRGVGRAGDVGVGRRRLGAVDCRPLSRQDAQDPGSVAPGGDRALYPVVFAPFFSKNLPGNPTVQPVFMPGAGGSTAINYTYGVAAPDGLTIVTPLVAVVTPRRWAKTR